MSRDVIERAKALGHTGAQLEEGRGRNGGGGWRVTCSCGYRSAGRQTPALAMEALAHHLGKVTASRVMNGVSIPRQSA